MIRNTSGVYYPTQRASGKGAAARVTWERAGLKPTATFAEWDHAYEVKVKSAAFEVDTVQFNDPYFEKTLIGTVTDKVLANVDEDNASYPRFESYDRRMKIRDIVEGIDFEGGFTMQGAKLQGYGTKDEPAFLTFYRDKRALHRHQRHALQHRAGAHHQRRRERARSTSTRTRSTTTA